MYALGKYTHYTGPGDPNAKFCSQIRFSKELDKTYYFLPMMKELCDELKEKGILSDIQVITIVPRHKGTYSVTLEALGKALAKHLGVEYVQLIERVRNCKENHKEKLSVAERYLNTAGSMKVNKNKLKPSWKGILVLDDVKTSGISLLEVRKILVESGFDKLVPICLAINE